MKDAVTYSPKIKGALIELIDCLYQLNRLEEAYTWIGEAEKEGIRPAQTSFLKGLVLVKDGKDKEAVAAFENSKALDKSMTQTCDYQIGMTYLKTEKYDEAKKAFEQIVLVDPNSNMANFANAYMDALSKREAAMKPFKITFGAAWQYDDNVVLKPGDAAIAASISDKADTRQVYTGTAEYNHRFNDRFSIKGQYFFYYGKQTDLGFYDQVSNTWVIQPSLNIFNGLLTFPSGYSHSLVNDKAYLSSPFTSGVYNFMVGSRNMGQVFIKYVNKDFLWTASTPDDNRDSDDLGGGAGWYYFYAKNRGFVNARYVFNKETTKGNNWDYMGNRATLSILVPALEKLNITVSGDMYMQNYLNTHTIFNVGRRDQIYTVSALAAYKFYKDSEVQLQYTYVKDSSNISVYDYDRNIFSVGVDVKF